MTTLLHEFDEEADRLDQAIRARKRGEKLAIWLNEQEDLIVLFDGKCGSSMDDYDPDGYPVVPGASLIIDRTRSNNAGAEVAGVRVEYPNHTLSRYFQKKWGGAYRERAHTYNRRMASADVSALWQLYVQVKFLEYAHHEDQGIRKFLDYTERWFRVFGEQVATHLEEITPVHIPLVVNDSYIHSLQ